MEAVLRDVVICIDKIWEHLENVKENHGEWTHFVKGYISRYYTNNPYHLQRYPARWDPPNLRHWRHYKDHIDTIIKAYNSQEFEILPCLESCTITYKSWRFSYRSILHSLKLFHIDFSSSSTFHAHLYLCLVYASFFAFIRKYASAPVMFVLAQCYPTITVDSVKNHRDTHSLLHMLFARFFTSEKVVPIRVLEKLQGVCESIPDDVTRRGKRVVVYRHPMQIAKKSHCLKNAPLNAMFCSPNRTLVRDVENMFEKKRNERFHGRHAEYFDMLSCSVDMADFSKAWDVVIIDEIGRILDCEEACAYVKALVLVNAKTVYLCGLDSSALEVVLAICRLLGDGFREERVLIHRRN